MSRLLRFISIVHEGFWLGCLNPDELNAVTAQNFDQSQFYASSSHNRSGFFQWEQKALDQFFREGSRVLVAGAGGGREVLALRQSGFAAEGFECSIALVQASQRIFDEAGESNYLTYCAPDTVPDGPAVYDALIVGWTVYTHIPTRLARIRFLQALHQRALLHAPLLLSCFIRSAPSNDDAMVFRIARFCSHFSRGRRDPIEMGDRIAFAKYVRWFSENELHEELRAAGFRLAHFAQDGDLGYAVAIGQ